MNAEVTGANGQKSPPALRISPMPLAHPWSGAAARPENPEIDFLRKELKLTEPQVKVLNWLSAVAGERFQFQNGQYRESACLHVVVPPAFADELPAVMVSLGFERTGDSPWSIEWRGTFRDEHPIATVRVDKGEIDIRRLPYRAPQGRGRESMLAEKATNL